MDHLDADTAYRYITGRLDQPAADACAQHLRACATCRKLVEQERALSGLLDLAGDVPLPDGKRRLERLLARVAEVPLRGRRGRHAFRWVGWAAVVGLGLGLGVQLAVLSSRPAESAAEMGIDPDTQHAVVSNLAALRALREEPWLGRDYEAVETLALLIDGMEPR